MLESLLGIRLVMWMGPTVPVPAPVDVTLPLDDVSTWERYEGMLVRFTQQLVVTGNFSLGAFGQIDLAPAVLFQPTHISGTAATWSAAAGLYDETDTIPVYEALMAGLNDWLSS